VLDAKYFSIDQRGGAASTIRIDAIVCQTTGADIASEN
jgi:hypothetical protein